MSALMRFEHVNALAAKGLFSTPRVRVRLLRSSTRTRTHAFSARLDNHWSRWHIDVI
jgi:hypothetical protein